MNMENVPATDLIYWKCGHCDNVHVSDPKQRHNMTFCNCGHSGLDAEEYYNRVMGEIIYMTKEEYDNGIKRK